MNANELRIGNLVSKDGLVYEADFITIRLAQNYKPIPLTEEWLFKFGFEKKPDMQYIWTSKVKSWWFIRDFLIIQMFINFNGIIDFRFNYPSSEPANFKFIEILYIHQLQNLYFALTGEELTIKKNKP